MPDQNEISQHLFVSTFVAPGRSARLAGPKAATVTKWVGYTG